MHLVAGALSLIDEAAGSPQGLERQRAVKDGSAQDTPQDPVDVSHSAGEALNERGESLLRTRSWEKAEPLFREAVAIFQRLGDRGEEGSSLYNLGLCLRERGLNDQATEVLGQALTLIGDSTGDQELIDMIACDLGVALTRQGIALVEQRRFGDAIAAHERAVALLREHGDRNGEGGALNNLAVAFYGEKRFAEAASACEQAVAIFRAIKDRALEGLALDGQGRALTMLQRFHESIAAHQAAAHASGMSATSAMRAGP